MKIAEYTTKTDVAMRIAGNGINKSAEMKK